MQQLARPNSYNKCNHMNFKKIFNRITTISSLATSETQKLLVLLLSMDAVFIILHIVYRLGFSADPFFSIEKDRGHAEFYQYTKELWACLLFVILAVRKPRLLYISWALLFFYLLLDDSMQVHETAGRAISEYFNFQPMFRLRPLDFGEMIVSAVSGTILFGLIAFSSLKSDTAERRVSVHMFFLILFLVFFGILIDMIHVASPGGHGILGLIEDGGEMVIMSVLLGYIFNLRRKMGKEVNAAD